MKPNFEIPKAKGYSIWLLFESEVEETLTSLMQRLKEIFFQVTNSFQLLPSFLPHLTLLSSIEFKIENSFNTFINAFENEKSITLNSKGLKFSNEFFRSIYIEIENTTELIGMREKLIKTFLLKDEQKKFIHHISLQYSYLEKTHELKRLILREIRIPSKIRANRISLVRTEGTVDEWEIFKIINLKT